MTQFGLSFAEFVALKVRPRAGVDEVAEMFPMPLRKVSDHLRSRGYDCRPAMLEVLVQDRVVTPANPDAWSHADVESAAGHFEDCELYTPYADMCRTLGCRYADFLRPLREAAERESAKYGRWIPEDDQYFVMHRIPPRGGDKARDAIISFTLCDDIRERLERGEEV